MKRATHIEMTVSFEAVTVSPEAAERLIVDWGTHIGAMMQGIPYVLSTTFTPLVEDCMVVQGGVQ